MCELFALSAKYPCHIKLSLEQFVEQAGGRNVDGWGLANLDGNDAYIYREPVSAQHSLLAHFLAQEGIDGNTILSHVRHCTVGDVCLANTHPFSREWEGQIHLFAFNGDVPDILDLYKNHNRFQAMGNTDAEWVFCLLLDRLIKAKNHDRNVMDVIHRFGCELANMGPCNFIYAVNDKIYAFASRRRYSDIERPPGLWRVTRQCKESQTKVSTSGVLVDFGVEVDQQITICASLPLTDENWQPFSVNELICISQGQLVDTRK